MVMARRGVLLLLILTFGISGCSRTMTRTETGAAAGAAVGAGLGAIIGSTSGDVGAGTVIGGTVGAVGGALVGQTLEKKDRDTGAVSERIARNQKELDENRRMIEELKRRGSDVTQTKRGVVITLSDVLFAFNKAELTPEAAERVGKISETLKTAKGRRVAVEGHTDSVGTDEVNLALSRRRAQAVADALVAHGTSRKQLHVAGFGKARPAASNDTPAGRAKNRRVEVVIENH